MKTYPKKPRLLKKLQQAILLVLVFLLASEPVFAAAQTLRGDPQAEAMDKLVNGGEAYLDSASKTVVESMELLGFLNTIHSAPIDQISETYVSDVIERALSVAEQSSIALGSVNVVGDGIEQLGGTLPAAMNVSEVTGAGIPPEMSADLIALGIPSANIDQVSASASELLSARQAGIPASVQSDLLGFGFTQPQIDQIALAVSERGLVDAGLTTKLDQFRATQDELADTRSGMLILAVQLLGYQIAARQVSGLAPRALTDAELDELAQDELRLLVHVAHLNAMWGSDPSAEVGEGDWWFIEHYAGRAAERLQALTVESQNRGLVAELFVLHQMKMLAVSARTGDAEYAQAELEGLAALLSHALNATAYYQERENPGFAEKAWARLTAAPALREKMEWSIPESVAKSTRTVIRGRMDTASVENLALVIGGFDESNENNNVGGLLIVAGLSFFDQLSVDTVQTVLNLGESLINGSAFLWLQAIMTGDTDNPKLLAANVIIGFIPVINVLSDLWTLLAASNPWHKAAAIFSLICDLGSTLAFIGLQVEIVGLLWLGKGASKVMSNLASKSAALLEAYKGMKLAKAVESIVQLVRTMIYILGDNILGRNLDEVISTLSELLTGTYKVWDDYVAFAARADTKLIIELGISRGSLLTGRIVRSGVSLSDEAFKSLKYVADDLIEAGAKLSDDAAKGLGHAASMFEKGEFENFVNALKNCSVGSLKGSAKLAIPAASGVPICDQERFKIALEVYGGVAKDAPQALKSFSAKLKGDDVAAIVKRYQAEPAEFKLIIDNLGEFVRKDTIKAAFQAGEKATGVGGPEALRAMVGWWLAPGNLLKDEAIAKELAQRAGTDAQAIKIASTWTTSSTPGVADVARLSVNGNGRAFALGPGGNYDGGWVQFARDNNADFYFTNPEVSRIVENLFPGDLAEQRRVFLSINSAALDGPDGPIKKSMDFLYQIIPNTKTDKTAVEKIWKGASDDEIKVILGITDPNKKIPFRMEELKLLFNNGYGYIFKADGNILFTLKPIPSP